MLLLFILSVGYPISTEVCPILTTNPSSLSQICTFRLYITIDVFIRFIDRPEQTISLEDFKSFLTECQNVSVTTHYTFIIAQSCFIRCLYQWIHLRSFKLCVHTGNMGHRWQQGARLYFQLLERSAERSGAALFLPGRGRPLPPHPFLILWCHLARCLLIENRNLFLWMISPPILHIR